MPPKPLEKRSKCPKGTIRNKKTGECVSKLKATAVDSPKTKKNISKLAKIVEQRRECIQKWREKHGLIKSYASSSSSSNISSLRQSSSDDEENTNAEKIESIQSNNSESKKKAAMDYDENIVFLFYSKSADKPYPGSGSGEKMPADKKPEYMELSKIPQWRKKLSNFWISEFGLNGHRWASVEHYYQGSKYRKDNPQVYIQFSLDSGSELSKDPAAAKTAGGKKGKIDGKNYKVDSDFFKGSRANDEMYAAQYAKFTQNEDMKELLIATKDAKLMHHVRGQQPVFFANLIKIRRELS